MEDKIHKELADKGRAEIYDVYFDFDSDCLRPESDQVLAEIARTEITFGTRLLTRARLYL